MSRLSLGNHEEAAKKAVQRFWATRKAGMESDAAKKQGGTRGAVLAGKSMDGFLEILSTVVRENGLVEAEIHTRGQPCLTLPGYYRPSKQWDVVVMHRERLIAAIEMKSQVGSIGKNFNNRAEEVVGMAEDFWMAAKEGALRDSQPFLGWLMLFEDMDADEKDVRSYCRLFPPFDEFYKSSYAKRYEILCRKMMKERLYHQAALMLTPQSAGPSGAYRELSADTGLGSFLAGFAGHVAIEAEKSRFA